MNQSLPVVVIGAGPVGLAAAAHLLRRRLEPLVLEAGPAVASNVRSWDHVQLFSPWRYSIDSASRELLEHSGWNEPPADEHPTGAELIERYLEPLGKLPEIASRLRFDSRVVAVTRSGGGKLKSAADREEAPFMMRVLRRGVEEEILARAVIDASGTARTPNPMGGDGLPALGECQLGENIAYGIPDLSGEERARYAGRRVLVVGSGHSAFNALLGLASLAAEEPGTRVLWAVRRTSLGQVFGGGERDRLPERGKLGRAVRSLVESGQLEIFLGFSAGRVRRTAEGILVEGSGRTLPSVDEIVVATGFRPELDMLRELRLELDPIVEAPVALAPLIDPNLHSCGTVRPHGAEQLAHPERGFYIVGMKSYGRAPTFLLLTGYEQVRSVAAAIAGDWESARDVQLVLPETGVCSLDLGGEAGGGCCGVETSARPAEAASRGTSSCSVPAARAEAAGRAAEVPTESGCSTGARSAPAPAAPAVQLQGSGPGSPAPSFSVADLLAARPEACCGSIAPSVTTAATEVKAKSTGCCGGEKGIAAPASVAAKTGSSGCCGGPATERTDACCKLDEQKKQSGEAGCGCSSEPAPAGPRVLATASCC